MENGEELLWTTLKALSLTSIFRIVTGKKVAEDSYWFRKGHSRSKGYGDGDPGTRSTPKRPKFDKEMKVERIRQIQDDLNNLTRLPLAFKEKRILQAEAGGDYTYQGNCGDQEGLRDASNQLKHQAICILVESVELGIVIRPKRRDWLWQLRFVASWNLYQCYTS